MAQIRHIAIRTRDVEETATFYKQAFGLKQVGTGRNGIYLTDGHLNIAILNLRPAVEGESMKLGIDHLGFQVEDFDAAVARIRALGGKILNDRNEVAVGNRAESSKGAADLRVPGAQPQSYFEVKCVGPDDQVIDVSSAGWVSATG